MMGWSKQWMTWCCSSVFTSHCIFLHFHHLSSFQSIHGTFVISIMKFDDVEWCHPCSMRWYKFNSVIEFDVLVFQPRLGQAAKTNLDSWLKFFFVLLTHWLLAFFGCTNRDQKLIINQFLSQYPTECVCSARAKHDWLEAWAKHVKFGPGPPKICCGDWGGRIVKKVMDVAGWETWRMTCDSCCNDVVELRKSSRKCNWPSDQRNCLNRVENTTRHHEMVDSQQGDGCTHTSSLHFEKANWWMLDRMFICESEKMFNNNNSTHLTCAWASVWPRHNKVSQTCFARNKKTFLIDEWMCSCLVVEQCVWIKAWLHLICFIKGCCLAQQSNNCVLCCV